MLLSEPRTVLRSLLWLALSAASPLLCAENSPPSAAMQSSRIAFERSIIESSLTPLKKHLSELVLLEKQYAEARDYDGAINARDLRKRLDDELERLDRHLLLLQTQEQSLHANTLPDRIPLKLEDAKLNGVTREGGALTRWDKPGASAMWKLSGFPPGGYEVYLRYRCGPLEGGTLIITEAKFSLQGNVETTLKGPEEKSLGTLKITDGNGSISIMAETVVKDNLMHLLGVELAPASR